MIPKAQLKYANFLRAAAKRIADAVQQNRKLAREYHERAAGIEHLADLYQHEEYRNRDVIEDREDRYVPFAPSGHPVPMGGSSAALLIGG